MARALQISCPGRNGRLPFCQRQLVAQFRSRSSRPDVLPYASYKASSPRTPGQSAGPPDLSDDLLPVGLAPQPADVVGIRECKIRMPFSHAWLALRSRELASDHQLCQQRGWTARRHGVPAPPPLDCLVLRSSAGLELSTNPLTFILVKCARTALPPLPPPPIIPSLLSHPFATARRGDPALYPTQTL